MDGPDNAPNASSRLTDTQKTSRPSLDAPVDEAHRLTAVDTLRGFGVLGILMINIVAMALPVMAMKFPNIAGGITGTDRIVWYISQTFFFQKFWSIFSMLFGAGLILMATRAEAAGRSFRKVYFRRLRWLLLFGLIHAYLLWWGDILYYYALCGMIAYLLRRIAAKWLITIGLMLFMLGVPAYMGMGAFFSYLKTMSETAQTAQEEGQVVDPLTQSMANTWRDIQKQYYPSDETIRQETEAMRGGFVKRFLFMAPSIVGNQTVGFILFILWKTLGLMLIGMGLLKLGVLSGTRSQAVHVCMIVVGYGAGLPLASWGASRFAASGFDLFYVLGPSTLYNQVSILLITAGHVGLLLWLWKSRSLQKMTARLAAVGRMALTNYLSQTIILTTFFYWFGLFGRFDRSQLLLFVLAVWILQLWWSPLWLKHFRFGPAEWLWRSLTYRRKQPMRRSDIDESLRVELGQSRSG